MDQELKEFQAQQINRKPVNLTHSRPVDWMVWNMGTDSNSAEGQEGNDILFFFWNSKIMLSLCPSS